MTGSPTVEAMKADIDELEFEPLQADIPVIGDDDRLDADQNDRRREARRVSDEMRLNGASQARIFSKLLNQPKRHS